VYAANKTSLLGGRLRLDYGLSFMNNTVDYSAPVHDSRTARFNFVNQADVGSGALPKAGALFALSPQTEVFAGAAKSAASVTDATLEGNSAATLAAARTVSRMDTAKAFDLGVRHRGSNFVAGLQAFSVRSTETIAADIAGTLQSENVDQGRRIQGLEASYSLRLANWRLYGAATVQQPRYVLTDVDANGNPPRGFIRNGADVVGIAPRNAFVEVTWRPTDALKLAANGRLVSSAAGYYANPRIANSGSDERIPGYALFGLSAAYAWDKLSVGLNIENLGNKAFISGVAPELMTTVSSVGRYFIGAPRSVAVWLKAEL
jgi:iron complex outermembrane recepter protein